MRKKFILAASRAMAIVAAAGIPGVALAADANANTNATVDDDAAARIAPDVILRLSQARYDAITNYCDEGRTVGTVGDDATAPCTYTIKLGRPNLYRIAWDQKTGAFDQNGAVWSAGAGDFYQSMDAVKKEAGMQDALHDVAGPSGGASATVPCAFFKLPWANPLGGFPENERRLPDERLGKVECCVITWEVDGVATTVWIGRHDLLIHQLQRVISAEVVKARLAAVAKQDPKLVASLQANDPKPVTSIEIHTNILVDQKLTAADFGK